LSNSPTRSERGGWVVVTVDRWRPGIAARTIAVVAASRDDTKRARTPSAYPQAVGDRIVGVDPTAQTIHGRRAHPSPASISDDLDRVQVIRPGDEATVIARDVVAIGAGGLWMQQGLTSAAAPETASAAGIGGLEDTGVGTHLASMSDFPTPLES
jgi:uncharacterized protein